MCEYNKYTIQYSESSSSERIFALGIMISEARDSILHTLFDSVIYLFSGFHTKQ